MVRLHLSLHASSQVTKAAVARILVHFRLVGVNLTSEKHCCTGLSVGRGQDEASRVSCMVLLLHSTFIPAGLP